MATWPGCGQPAETTSPAAPCAAAIRTSCARSLVEPCALASASANGAAWSTSAWMAGEDRPSAVARSLRPKGFSSSCGARVDLDVRAEDPSDAAREAFAAANNDGVRAELGADLRQDLLEAAAAERLGLEGRIHVHHSIGTRRPRP